MNSSKSTRKPAAKDRIDADLWAEFESIADSAGLELVHAEFAGGNLRLFIDRADGGVTLSDCEHVSKMVSALLDVVDFGRQRYMLEVSSPGLDRQLYRPRDYERFAGHKVRVTFFARGEGGGKRTVVGRLEALRAAGPEGSQGEITVTVDADGERLDIPLADVQMARLEVEL